MQADTTTKQHQWTQMAIVPVTVMGFDGEDNPVAVPTMEPDVRIGCFKCLVGLTPDTQYAECEDPLPDGHQGMDDPPPVGIG